MKFLLLLCGGMAIVSILFWGCSCAYTIPNGGQAVINDVTDIVNNLPTATAAGGSQTHAQARSAQSQAFWGGAK